MSREKQIDEMARIIDDNHGFIVSSVETAKALYNAGYRKQKEGEWENVYNHDTPDGHLQRKTACSVCGYKPKGDICGKTPFCPNCGAKMKGGAE